MDAVAPAVPSLYRRVLKEAFDTLPPALRRFHDQPAEGVAVGSLRVTRGDGWLRHLAAALMRLPPAGACVPIRLEVRVEGDQERWIRHFDGLRLETLQWHQNDLLIEAVGPLRFELRVEADRAGMQFRSVRCRLFMLPLPAALAPRICANITGRESGWWVDVRVETPWMGLLARYEGEVRPLWKPR